MIKIDEIITEVQRILTPDVLPLFLAFLVGVFLSFTAFFVFHLIIIPYQIKKKERNDRALAKLMPKTLEPTPNQQESEISITVESDVDKRIAKIEDKLSWYLEACLNSIGKERETRYRCMDERSGKLNDIEQKIINLRKEFESEKGHVNATSGCIIDLTQKLESLQNKVNKHIEYEEVSIKSIWYDISTSKEKRLQFEDYILEILISLVSGFYTQAFFQPLLHQTLSELHHKLLDRKQEKKKEQTS